MLPVVYLHLLFIIPPILGVLWTLAQWRSGARINLGLDDAEGYGSFVDAVDEPQETMKQLVGYSEYIAYEAFTFSNAEYMWMGGFIVFNVSGAHALLLLDRQDTALLVHYVCLHRWHCHLDCQGLYRHEGGGDA